MRLREIQKIIEDNLPLLYDTDSEYLSMNGSYKINKYSDNFIAIHNIEKLGIINPEYDIMFENNLFVNSAKNTHIIFSKEQNELYLSLVKRIVNKSEACLALITKSLHSESENEHSLVISMPDRELTFHEFHDIVETLNETLRLLSIIPEFQSDIKLSNFDVGSEWFVLSFLADKAVKIFGRLTSVVQRTQVGMKQSKALDDHLETLELDAKTLSDFKEATAKANAKINEDLAKRFLEEENLDSTGEILNQMTKVIENTDKLMILGLVLKLQSLLQMMLPKHSHLLLSKKNLIKLKLSKQLNKLKKNLKRKWILQMMKKKTNYLLFLIL